MSIRVRTIATPMHRNCDGCGHQPQLQIVLTAVIHDTPRAMAVDLCRRCFARLQKLTA